MFRKYLRSALSIALMAMLGVGLMRAWSVPGPVSGDQGPITFKATGSTSNQANPGCNGKANSSCNGNAPVKEFILTLGSTDALYPGLARTLPVTFTNPQSFDIKVTTLNVSAERAPMNTNCPVADLSFPSGTTNLSPAVVIPRKASAGTTLMVGLKSSASEACESAEFVITVTATAVKS